MHVKGTSAEGGVCACPDVGQVTVGVLALLFLWLPEYSFGYSFLNGGLRIQN
jgi:hypothetical protein